MFPEFFCSLAGQTPLPARPKDHHQHWEGIQKRAVWHVRTGRHSDHLRSPPFTGEETGLAGAKRLPTAPQIPAAKPPTHVLLGSYCLTVDHDSMEIRWISRQWQLNVVGYRRGGCQEKQCSEWSKNVSWNKCVVKPALKNVKNMENFAWRLWSRNTSQKLWHRTLLVASCLCQYLISLSSSKIDFLIFHH